MLNKVFKSYFSQVGGLPMALAMSDILTMTVFIPFPFPSTLAKRRGIL